MGKRSKVIERDAVVIRFSGDSGDGMQLTGTLFSNTSALFGHDLSTFPDYPAEIRAPQGTVGGVSGFQVHIGHKQINTPGDYPDILVNIVIKKDLTTIEKKFSYLIPDWEFKSKIKKE